jgi:UDP-N-acetylglucosamine 3-dehydrogenase
MGRNHLRVLRETWGADLVAVVDPHAPEPRDLGGAHYLRSTRELASVSFDAAVIATPTETHGEVAAELIAMGKHVLIEKPIASTFRESREVLLAAQERGTTLVVGHVERFNPAVRMLREVIRAGFVGTPMHFAFTRVGGYPDTLERGNNVVLDLAVHDIDVIRHLLGPIKVEHCVCQGTSREGIVDTAQIFLSSDSGASATVHVDWNTPRKSRTIRVTGSRGVCLVDYMLQTCELLGGSHRIQLGVRKIEPLRAQAEQLRSLLSGGDAGDLCTGKDALAAVLLAERALEVGRARARPAALEAGGLMLTGTDEWV